MTPEKFDVSHTQRILKLLGRFNKLSGTEIRDLTSLTPEEINDGIDYLKNLGTVKIKGEDPPFNFSFVSLTKDGIKLYNRKLLEGQ